MSNIIKFEFNVLDISGKNYLTWILDAEIHLNAMGLGDTIKEENVKSEQEKAKAVTFLRHHLHEDLKSKSNVELWKDLKERYDHQKTVILPKARYDWLHLCLQDYKSVSEYNSAMFKITSQLKLCGKTITDKDMLEKNYSTFHANNMRLQQYRERGFMRYSELISVFHLAKQNNKLLMKNHQARPTRSTPFPEANVVTSNDYGQNKQFGRGQGRGHGYRRGRGYSRGRGFGRGRGHNSQNFSKFKKKPNHLKWTMNEEKGNVTSKRVESTCYRYGMKGHWSRTSKHFVDLYQATLKNVETNFTEQNDPLRIAHLKVHFGGADQVNRSDLTHMKVIDFFEDVEMDGDKANNN